MESYLRLLGVGDFSRESFSLLLFRMLASRPDFIIYLIYVIPESVS